MSPYLNQSAGPRLFIDSNPKRTSWRGPDFSDAFRVQEVVDAALEDPTANVGGSDL